MSAKRAAPREVPDMRLKWLVPVIYIFFLLLPIYWLILTSQ